MHKGFELLNPDVEKQYYGSNELRLEIPYVELNEGKKNIVFLDIDGVIQPYDSRYRFAHSCDLTMEKLRKEYNPELVDEGECWDILATYYDWDETALCRIAKICRHFGAYIVLHSSWIGGSSPERLKLFFELHGMGDYVLDVCQKYDDDKYLFHEKRPKERELGYMASEKEIIILEWLDAHAGEVQDYIVIDDDDMSWTFGSRFICTSNIVSDMDYEVARSVMNRWMRYRQYDDETICIGDTFLRYRTGKAGTREVLFFITEFTDYLRSNVSFARWIKDIRILIMILKGKYFCRERNEKYKNIAFLCWCWPMEYHDEEMRDILKTVNIGYTNVIRNEKVYIEVLKARGEDYFKKNSGEDKEVCAAGEKLIENFGRKKIERDSCRY